MRYGTIRLAFILLVGLLMMGGGFGSAMAKDDTGELVAGNSAFAFDVYHAVSAKADGNFMVSPYSISQALAMTYGGARGNTEAQMAATLHFTLPQDRLHPAFNALQADLDSRDAESLPDSAGQRFQLNIANAVWGQRGFPFLDDYLRLLEAYYGAGLQLVDFVNATEAARQTINAWVEDQTEDRIQELIPPGILDQLTRLVLTNAVYFNASWLHPFEESATQDDTFTLLDGSAVTVPMMQQQETFAYGAGEDFQMLELPYVGGDVAMLIVLPDAGHFEAVEGTLNPTMLRTALAAMTPQRVDVALPRFGSEFDVDLAALLAAMGMPDAFNADLADFSGMVSDPELHKLYISNVLHKSFIQVDEAGTEAAAATAVIMKERGMMIVDTIPFRVDRPFVYVIYDKLTGTVLFVGRILNPVG